MMLELDSPRIPLRARGLARLPDATSSRIVCESGSVWITIDGDPRDIVLMPGESFRVDRRAGVLMYALEDTCLRIDTGVQASSEASPSEAGRPPTMRYGIGVV